jgi:hypothetical protein
MVPGRGDIDEVTEVFIRINSKGAAPPFPAIFQMVAQFMCSSEPLPGNLPFIIDACHRNVIAVLWHKINPLRILFVSKRIS